MQQGFPTVFFRYLSPQRLILIHLFFPTALPSSLYSSALSPPPSCVTVPAILCSCWEMQNGLLFWLLFAGEKLPPRIPLCQILHLLRWNLSNTWTRDTHIEIRHVQPKDAKPEGLHLSKAYFCSVFCGAMRLIPTGREESGGRHIKKKLAFFAFYFLIGFHYTTRRSGSLFQIR